MACRFLSRRRFLEDSLSGGLAVGLELCVEPWRATAAAISGTDALSLKVTGDPAQGFGVSLLFNSQPITRHNRGGEFSAIFQNEDRSVEDHVENWKATTWAGDATRLTLKGECKLENL